MVKRLDPFEKGMSKTEILVKVQNNEENYQYQWGIEQFRNRLFMIRELLEEFFDTGDLPDKTKEEDCFWDPPKPILIGQCFLQLQNLSLMFSNELERATIFSINDDENANKKEQGTINIRYSPCDQEGNEGDDYIPDDFIVESAEELIGKQNMYFKVGILGAKNLPESLCCNAFVTYQFQYDS